MGTKQSKLVHCLKNTFYNPSITGKNRQEVNTSAECRIIFIFFQALRKNSSEHFLSANMSSALNVLFSPCHAHNHHDSFLPMSITRHGEVKSLI